MNYRATLLLSLLTLVVEAQVYDEGFRGNRRVTVRRVGTSKTTPSNDLGWRILNGWTVLRDSDFPFMARLEVVFSNQGAELCGASLIHTRWLMTAAHCLRNAEGENAQEVRVYLGSRVITRAKLVLRSTEFNLHPLYSRNETIDNDVALIKLPFDLSDNATYASLQPIDVPTFDCESEYNENSNRIDHCYSVTALGWGLMLDGNLANVLQKTSLSLLSFSECKRTFKRTPFSVSKICAGSNGKSDTCSGDSGGPIICRGVSSDVSWNVIGITSFGPRDAYGQASCGNAIPAIYTRVCGVRDFIDSVLCSDTLRGITLHNAKLSQMFIEQDVAWLTVTCNEGFSLPNNVAKVNLTCSVGKWSETVMNCTRQDASSNGFRNAITYDDQEADEMRSQFVNLQFHFSGGYVNLCAGRLLTNTTVITSAQCLYRRFLEDGDFERYQRAVARPFIADLRATSALSTIDVVSSNHHPSFNASGSTQFDLAIVELSEPIENFEPSILKLPWENLRPPSGGVEGCRSGTVYMWDRKGLAVYFSSSLKLRCNSEGQVLPGQFCGSTQDRVMKGAPLICRNAMEEWFQVGLASDSVSDSSVVYTRLNFYRRWIDLLL